MCQARARLSKMHSRVNARFDTIYRETAFNFILFLWGVRDKNWSHFSILNIVSVRPKKKKNHHWLNPSLSKIESGIPFWRGEKVKPYSCVVWRRGGLNLGVPEFSFERNEIVNELIKKKGNGWAERKGIMLRLFNVLCQSGKWFTPRLYTPPSSPLLDR